MTSVLTKSRHVPYNARNILVKIIYVCWNTFEGLCVDDDRRDRVEEDTFKLTEKKEFEGISRILSYFLPVNSFFFLYISLSV